MTAALEDDLPVLDEGVLRARTWLGQIAREATLGGDAQTETRILLQSVEVLDSIVDPVRIHAISDLGAFVLNLPREAVDWLCDILLEGWREQPDAPAFRELRAAFVVSEVIGAVGLGDHDWTLLEAEDSPAEQPVPLALCHADGDFPIGVWVLDFDAARLPPVRARTEIATDLTALSVRLRMALPPIASALRDITAIEPGDLFVLPGRHAALPIRVGIGNAQEVAGSVTLDGVCTLGGEEERADAL